MMKLVIEEGAVQQLAQGFVRVLESYEDIEDVFAPDAFFDINVPIWRFQLRGTRHFIAWLQGYCSQGYRISAKAPVATNSGFVLEVDGEYAGHGGIELYFRNLYVCRVENGRISEVSFWCTGDWDPETRELHRVEVELLRP